MENIKWEKRIPEKKLDDFSTLEEMAAYSDDIILQTLKDYLTEDAEFEIIEPKQLPNSNTQRD